MTEILETWSLPWHALQRRLATKTTADSTWPKLAVRKMVGSLDPAGAQISWLVRARARVQPVAGRGP